MQRRKRVVNSAIDATGLSATSASAYFIEHRAIKSGPWKTITYHRYPMLGVVTDVASHFIIAHEAKRGPCPDVGEFKALIRKAGRRLTLANVLADAGYDSESNHKYARDELSLRTIIPPKIGRPTSKLASGHYPRLMQTRRRNISQASSS